MLAQARPLAKAIRIPVYLAPQRCALHRLYSTSSNEAPWFEQLRAEMLNRDVRCSFESFQPESELRLSKAFSGFLPEEWSQVPTRQNPIVPISSHLIHFNQVQSSNKLLPDGTDLLHSPGEPWVRRMWAGGTVHVRPDKYFHRQHGFIHNVIVAAAERIKDVQLVEKNSDAKIFVTIERRYTKLSRLHQHQRKMTNNQSALDTFKQQLLDNDEWGDAFLKTETILVFLQEKTANEIKDIKAGRLVTPKYLKPPGIPEFSHSLIPTQSLLFNYSSLTCNSHLIHLDRDYARNVEGHRNLLVHGPLSLTIMLNAASAYLGNLVHGEHLKSFEYRNLTPLYCDESLTVCIKEKKKFWDGSLYDVWLEGPTNGMAVKGTLRTLSKRNKPSNEFPAPADIPQQNATSPSPAKKAVQLGRDTTDGPLTSNATGSLTSDQSSHSRLDVIRHQNRPTKTKFHKFVSPSKSILQLRRVETLSKYIRPTMTFRSRRIARRARRIAPPGIFFDPVPIVRYHGARPYQPNVDLIAAKHSRFKRGGARRIQGHRIRYTGLSLQETLEEETLPPRARYCHGEQVWDALSAYGL